MMLGNIKNVIYQLCRESLKAQSAHLRILQRCSYDLHWTFLFWNLQSRKSSSEGQRAKMQHNEIEFNPMKASYKSMFRMSYAEKGFQIMYLSSRAVHRKIHKSHEFAIEDCDTVVVLCQLLKLGKDMWYLIWQPVLKFIATYIIRPRDTAIM